MLGLYILVPPLASNSLTSFNISVADVAYLGSNTWFTLLLNVIIDILSVSENCKFSLLACSLSNI